MAALLFAGGDDPHSWVLPPGFIQQPTGGVPLDQPLSVQCNSDYELDMRRFPGLEAEMTGQVAPEPALHIAAQKVSSSHTNHLYGDPGK